jgi:hypothetical protein
MMVYISRIKSLYHRCRQDSNDNDFCPPKPVDAGGDNRRETELKLPRRLVPAIQTVYMDSLSAGIHQKSTKKGAVVIWKSLADSVRRADVWERTKQERNFNVTQLGKIGRDKKYEN